MKNNQKPKMYISLAASVIFLLIAFFSISNFHTLGGIGGALFMISILISGTSFACIFIFRRRSDALEKIMGQESRIFHYPKKRWQQYLKNEYKLRGNEKKGIFILLTIITSVIFLIFIAVIDEARLAMFLVMLALIGMFAFMAFIVPRISYRFAKDTGEIGILDKGVMINGTLHTWDFPLSKLGSIKEKKKPFHHYQISYDFVDRLGPRSYVIRLPFPKEEKEFRDAIDRLR